MEHELWLLVSIYLITYSCFGQQAHNLKLDYVNLKFIIIISKVIFLCEE